MAGAIAGVVAVSVWGNRGSESESSSERSSVLLHEERDASSRDHQSGAIAALERRIAELEITGKSARIELLNQPKAEVTPPSEAEIADIYEKEIGQWNEELEHHRSEPFSGAWAREIASAIDQDLDAIRVASPDVAIGHVDCRSKSCVVPATWPSYQAAVNGYADIFFHHGQTSCARKMILPRPPEGQEEQPYEATLLMTKCDGS